MFIIIIIILSINTTVTTTRRARPEVRAYSCPAQKETRVFHSFREPRAFW